MAFTQEELAEIERLEKEEFEYNARKKALGAMELPMPPPAALNSNSNSHYCPICKNRFNNPATLSPYSLIVEIFIFVFSLLFLSLFLGALGTIIAFVVMCIISIIKRCLIRKVCPYCKSPNFYKI